MKLKDFIKIEGVNHKHQGCIFIRDINNIMEPIAQCGTVTPLNVGLVRFNGGANIGNLQNKAIGEEF